MVAAGVPAAGLTGGWRDCCIVIAPERSGSGWHWNSIQIGFNTKSLALSVRGFLSTKAES
jgi:hypothetical protein